MNMDLTETTAPRSDQQNFDDYVSGPKTVTVERVSRGSDEQPVDIHLMEFPGRPYKPSKSMRRVLIAAWGPEAAAYAGRRMTLYGDPTVRFGATTVGGIKISHLSHIDKPVTVNLTVARGKRSPFTVKPLADEAPAPTPDPLIAAKRRVAAVAPEGTTDLRAWVAAALDARGLDGTKVADLIALAEELEQ